MSVWTNFVLTIYLYPDSMIFNSPAGTWERISAGCLNTRKPREIWMI